MTRQAAAALQAQRRRQERPKIGGFVDQLRGRLAAAVTGARLHPGQRRRFAFAGGLEAAGFPKPGASAAIALLLVCCGSLSAALGHHSNRAIYDREKILSIEGTVAEVWYQNPHSRVYVEVTEENGGTALWQAETLDRSQLDRRGWKYNDLVAGDFVVVTGRVAFDGSKRLQMLTIMRPADGWEGVGYGAD